MREIKPSKKFIAELDTAPDKSITHRAVMFLCAAKGRAKVTNALMSLDSLATVDCMRKLGARAEIEGNTVYTEGTEDFLGGQELYAANSGTTMRLLSGLIAGRVNARISGDASLSRRPMDRIIVPLRAMNARITSDGYAPLSFAPSGLFGIKYEMPVASAQVKSAVLLAGLNADGETVVTEKDISRNHTELMLMALGADITVEAGKTTVRRSTLNARDIEVPGDISSAAFPLVLAAITKDARVTVRNVGVNPTRSGLLDIFTYAGVRYSLSNRRTVCGEDVADITVEGGKIRPFEIGGGIIPRLIDEIPALCVLACFAEGRSIIKDAKELKVKESDRIELTAQTLSKFGARVYGTEDGLVIDGTGGLKGGAEIFGGGDHRIVMAAAVAARASERGGVVLDGDAADISYPGFFDMLEKGE